MICVTTRDMNRPRYHIKPTGFMYRDWFAFSFLESLSKFGLRHDFSHLPFFLELQTMVIIYM